MGLEAPDHIRNIRQTPVEGISLAYSLRDAQAASRRTIQHYYIFGSRAIYQDGWKASLSHHNPFAPLVRNARSNEGDWELYNLNEDYTERVDLAKTHPQKLAELKALFEAQAEKYNLYPLVTWEDTLSKRPAPKKTP